MPAFKKIRVTFDDGGDFPTFEAWSSGKRWNGFEVPYFEYGEAQRVAEAARRAKIASIRFDSMRRAFVTRIERDPPRHDESHLIVTPNGRKEVWNLFDAWVLAEEPALRERGQGRARETRRKSVERDHNFAGYDFTTGPQGTRVRRQTIDTAAPGDYGADPIGDGTFRMVPSGDIVDYAERNRRLNKGGAREMRARGEDDEPDRDLQIPGWRSGWDDEISAHAAVSNIGDDKLVMTAGEYDSAPMHLNDEVVVGLYREDGEGGWDQIGYADFDSVHEVLALSKAALKRKLTEDSSLGEGRARERALRTREAPRRGGLSKYRPRPR